MKWIVLSLLTMYSTGFQNSLAHEQQRNMLGIGISIEPALFGSSLYYYSSSYGPAGYLLGQPAYASLPYQYVCPSQCYSQLSIGACLGGVWIYDRTNHNVSRERSCCLGS